MLGYERDELVGQPVESLVPPHTRRDYDLPSEVARERIMEALRQLDDTVHDIRTYAFSPGQEGTPYQGVAQWRR